MGTDDTVPMHVYSAALDEIYQLRQALAYEAQVTQAHGEYATFPKSRRPMLQRQIERLRQAATGHVEVAYAGVPGYSLRSARRAAEMPDTLTRAAWEAQRVVTRGR